jgi:hypothetical protein
MKTARVRWAGLVIGISDSEMPKKELIIITQRVKRE